jgi:hypothetical protein
MRLLLAVCFVVALGGIACAGERRNSIGAGAISCGKFAEQYRSHPEQTETIYVIWAQGFISGVNAILYPQGKFVDLQAKTLEEWKAFLRRYCNEHPLASYGSGVFELMSTLPVVQRDK